MSLKKLTATLTGLVFTLFGFTILLDAFYQHPQRVASPLVGIGMVVVGLAAFWLSREV